MLFFTDDLLEGLHYKNYPDFNFLFMDAGRDCPIPPKGRDDKDWDYPQL